MPPTTSIFVHDAPLPYIERLAKRDPLDVDLVVVHCTELPDVSEARRYAEIIHYQQTQTGNSGHYYVDRDGTVLRYVPGDRVAHHVRGHNARSVGVELINSGRFPHWFHSEQQVPQEEYPDTQIDALIKLLEHCASEFDNLRFVAGHADLDTDEVAASNDPSQTVRRKIDPGPQFPWARVTTSVNLKRWRP